MMLRRRLEAECEWVKVGTYMGQCKAVTYHPLYMDIRIVKGE